MTMISVDGFYELNLRGKTVDEILDVMSDLYKKIVSIEKEIESGAFDDTKPSLRTRLSMERKYLKRAEQAYEEVCPKEDDGPEALLQLIELLEACQKNNPRKDEEINWEDIDE